MKPIDKDRAKNYAINDIGLTEDEAEEAIAIFGNALEDYHKEHGEFSTIIVFVMIAVWS